MLSYFPGWVQDFLSDEEGASAIEYGLIIGLIAVVLIAVLILVGGADDDSGLRGLFSRASDAIGDAGNGGGGGT